MANMGKAPKRPWIASQGKHERRKKTKFYHSPQWRATRASHIKKEPFCRECDSEGKSILGNVVDHIVPIEQGGDPFHESNLQTLCHRHHNIKSAKEKRTKSH